MEVEGSNHHEISHEFSESQVIVAAELKNYILAIASFCAEQNNFAPWDEIANYGQHLRQAYGDEVTHYWLFHILSGSTVAPSHYVKFFDFEGEDSVESFVRNLYSRTVANQPEPDQPT